MLTTPKTVFKIGLSRYLPVVRNLLVNWGIFLDSGPCGSIVKLTTEFAGPKCLSGQFGQIMGQRAVPPVKPLQKLLFYTLDLTWILQFNVIFIEESGEQDYAGFPAAAGREFEAALPPNSRGCMPRVAHLEHRERESCNCNFQANIDIIRQGF